MFTGTYTALVTPFRDGKIDDLAYAALIERQIAGGVDGIVPVGTTGESPTVTHAEHHHLVRLAVRTAAGRTKVIAGAGSNSTAEAISLAREAHQSGADALLVVCPYYNKPTQEGLYQHYSAIAQATPLPVMLYNIPGRTGCDLLPPTVARLAQDQPTIVSLKEAAGSVERITQLRSLLPSAFTLLSGDDSLTLPFIAVGADGVVSVASNVIPAQVAHLVRTALNGNRDEAIRLNQLYFPLFKNLFLEPNPGPAKAALHLLGHLLPDVRLPLVPTTPATIEILRQTLADLGIVE